MRPTRAARANPLFRTLATWCRKYLNWFDNASLRPHKNGERWVLEALRGEDLRTVLDVGANIGDWALLAEAALPGATIYALEVVPATCARLGAATAGHSRIRCFAHGLADHSGLIRVRYEPSASTHATFTDYPRAWQGGTIECPVMAGDEFLLLSGSARPRR
ncbi:MAG: FkbM family methyltransferase [Gemmatimonadetes bacterium]|nr:FkbM family methyltransferase [Gemmatimonadota bacterium]